KDPLVINFGGTAAQLTSQRFKFDLDADGKTEDINFVAGGSGFLALDRNGDGKINDGAELFGAKTGNGFAELAALDADKNGWIDENDASYADLRVWTKDGAGKDKFSTLKQANVGAISLSHIATQFDLKDAQNVSQGEIKASGIYLQETGAVGTIQQIDLTV
nr:VCBS repeat-containing protein [Propionivibrio sp.]